MKDPLRAPSRSDSQPRGGESDQNVAVVQRGAQQGQHARTADREHGMGRDQRQGVTTQPRHVRSMASIGTNADLYGIAGMWDSVLRPACGRVLANRTPLSPQYVQLQSWWQLMLFSGPSLTRCRMEYITQDLPETTEGRTTYL